MFGLPLPFMSRGGFRLLWWLALLLVVCMVWMIMVEVLWTPTHHSRTYVTRHKSRTQTHTYPPAPPTSTINPVFSFPTIFTIIFLALKPPVAATWTAPVIGWVWEKVWEVREIVTGIRCGDCWVVVFWVKNGKEYEIRAMADLNRHSENYKGIQSQSVLCLYIEARMLETSKL